MAWRQKCREPAGIPKMTCGTAKVKVKIGKNGSRWQSRRPPPAAATTTESRRMAIGRKRSRRSRAKGTRTVFRWTSSWMAPSGQPPMQKSRPNSRAAASGSTVSKVRLSGRAWLSVQAAVRLRCNPTGQGQGRSQNPQTTRVRPEMASRALRDFQRCVAKPASSRSPTRMATRSQPSSNRDGSSSISRSGSV